MCPTGETVQLARTQLPKAEVFSLIHALADEYTGPSYHLLRRNCCHFADDLCQRLGVGPVPTWVCRLANLGDGALSGFAGMEDRMGILQLSRSVLTAVPSSQAPLALSAPPRRSLIADVPRGVSRDGMPL